MKIIKITNDGGDGEGDTADLIIYRFSEVSEADTGNIEAVALYFFTYLLSYMHMYYGQRCSITGKITNKDQGSLLC